MKVPARRLGAVLTLSLLAVATPLTAAAQTVPVPGSDAATRAVGATAPAPAAPGSGAVTVAAWAAAAQADTTATADQVAAEQAVADVTAALDAAGRTAGLAREAADQTATRVADTGQAVLLAEGALAARGPARRSCGR